MRLSTYLALGFVLVSAAFTAPLTTRDTAMVGIRAGPASGIEFTIEFEAHPYVGIHEHLTAEYNAAVERNVRALIRKVAASDLDAPIGLDISFNWKNTPSPDASKPVKYKVSTEQHGQYIVVMSHETPMTNVIVKDSMGRVIRQEGNRCSKGAIYNIIIFGMVDAH
ncbi:hypothetical protein GGU10DRAFT_336903 [Lentinula aff. detonsa]|uniref:Uncharacterized protein n=1 Tax=Lentinula aff. detonsa TaxID=2804958 RepID=A0AA38NJ30_9AGAR|nr:hypothetical protein GGU10DRAFT_336903 [Lentinula aff. detonsa]